MKPKMIVLFDAAAYEQKDAVRTIKRGDGDYSKYTFGTSFHDTAYSSCRVKYTDPTSKTTYAKNKNAETENCGSFRRLPENCIQ